VLRPEITRKKMGKCFKIIEQRRIFWAKSSNYREKKQKVHNLGLEAWLKK
jgi:hypothetical protein